MCSTDSPMLIALASVASDRTLLEDPHCGHADDGTRTHALMSLSGVADGAAFVMDSVWHPPLSATVLFTSFGNGGDKKVPSCRFCGFTARTTTRVQIHERTHTGEKPFKCQYCAYRASQRYNVRVHERTHTVEKPFKCKHCSYRSTTSSRIQVHERTHARPVTMALDEVFVAKLTDVTATYQSSHSVMWYTADQL